MADNYKLFVISHSSNDVQKIDGFQPILAGNKEEFVPQDFLSDNLGDNISYKNPTYNELTAIYWVYKHLNDFKECKYIGFCHYRRYFCFNDQSKTAYVKKQFDNNLCCLHKNQIDQYFKDFDLIVPLPSHYKSVMKHYNKAHNDKDLKIILEIISKLAPKYLKSAKDYLNGSREYLYNMFVLRKEDFLEYSNFIFPVLKEFEKHKDLTERFYVSERLTGIFITYLINQGKAPLHLPILHIREKSFKRAKSQVKKNFEEKRDKGLVFKLKPLILYFLPTPIEQHFRRRKTK